LINSFHYSHSFLSLNKCSDTINHVLNKSLFGSTESSSVGDVEDTVISLRVLSVDTSDLDVVLISDGIELGLILLEFWELDMDRGSQGSSEIGWARGNVTEMFVMRELADGFNMSAGSAESVEDSEDIGSLLHRDDSELIFLINPNVEGFFIVMENTSTGWPVSVQVASFKESISLFEKDVIGDELVLVLLGHTVKWVELTFKVTLESVASLDSLLHDL